MHEFLKISILLWVKYSKDGIDIGIKQPMKIDISQKPNHYATQK